METPEPYQGRVEEGLRTHHTHTHRVLDPVPSPSLEGSRGTGPSESTTRPHNWGQDRIQMSESSMQPGPEDPLSPLPTGDGFVFHPSPTEDPTHSPLDRPSDRPSTFPISF